jgi:alpha-2-macroglobulin
MEVALGRLGRRAKVFLAGATLLIGVVSGAVIVLGIRSGEDEGAALGRGVVLGLEMLATDEDEQGIGLDSHFVLTSETPLTAAGVRAALNVQPPVELEVERVSANEFHLVPRSNLEPDRVYHFTYRPAETRALAASWAFQVRSPLRVVSTIPANESARVPVDSGIEITFSHDGVVRPEDFVEITPLPDGHFEQHKRTLVFVPRELRAETLYTVRVRPGVPVAGSDLVLEDEVVFRFETGDHSRGGPSLPAARLDFLHRVAEAGTAEAPLVSVVTGDASLESLAIEVFAYPSLDAFIADLEAREQVPVWAVYTRARSPVDTSALQSVLTFDAPIEGRQALLPQGFFGPARLFFRFPDRLPEGLYLMETHYRDEPVQAWLQITDIATYLAVSTSSTLTWVNDVSTGLPIRDAQIEVIGRSVLGRTDSQGISSFATPDYLTSSVSRDPLGGASQTFGLSFVKISDGQGRQAIVPISPVLPPSLMSGRCGAFSDFAYGYGGSDYWTFLSTDRPVYQPTDIVNFWGVAKSRDGDAERDLELRLTGYTSFGRSYQAIGAGRTVRTSDLGTFTGNVPLEGVEPGYYTLSIYDEERFVASAFVRVEQYQKPPYQISVKPSQAAYLSGEQVEVEVEARFFDGTPLPGLALNYQTKGGFHGDLTTDAAGRARFSFTASFEYSRYQPVEVGQISVAPVIAEAGEVSGSASIGIFPSALHTTARATFEDGAVTVAGDVYRIDPTRFEGMQDFYVPYSASGRPKHVTDPAPGTTLTLTVTEQSYEAIVIGEYYDFVNKISRPMYRYEHRTRPVTTLTTTSDALGNFSVSFPARERTSYVIDISVTDDAGRAGGTQTWAYGGGETWFESSGMAYLTLSGTQGVYFASRSFDLGEQFDVTMRRGEASLPSGGANRYLFYESQRGIRHYTIQDNPVYRADFSDRHVPSAVIGGVFFNGFTYVEAQYGPTLTFNPRSRRLSIEIRSLQRSYRPGDEATVEVTVRDAEGRPAEAEVNLAAVDEAVFAVMDFYSYQTDILGQIYRPVPSGIIRTYASHQYPPQLLEPGGRGGGNGTRQDFPDVAFFGVVRTDASGRSQVTLKVPDNLTSWRVSAYGLTGDLRAGVGAGSVVVSLPFFVDVSLSNDYLLADKPVVGARAYGSALRGYETVEFVLKAPSLGLADGLKLTGRPFESVELPLPALAIGEHELKVEARASDLEDAIIKKVRVLESRLTAPKVTFYESVVSNQRLEGSPDGRTTLVFMDAGRGALYPLLQRLRWAYGDRVDQVLARAVAAQLLAEYFGEDSEAPTFDPSVYTTRPRLATSRPGVAVLPYAEADLALTAHVAALAPDLFGRGLLKAALESVAHDGRETPERLAIASFGLAALGEPVLISVRSLIGDADLGWRGRLHVALALEAAGDHPGAARVLDDLYSEFGQDLRTERRLRVGTDADDVLEATALAAMVAVGVGDAKADGLLRYVRSNRPQDVLLYLSELTFAKKALDRLAPEPASFAYSVGGRREEKRLERGSTFALSLSAAELAALRLEVIEGRLSVATRYMAPLAEAGLTPADDVSIKRTFLVDGQPGGVIGPASLVLVTLELSIGPQAPDGCYQVTDLLPSGLQPVTRAGSLFASRDRPPGYFPPGLVLPYQASGRKVSFCVGKGTNVVRYYARPFAKGEYVWEPATIHNQRVPSIFNLSEPATIRIE